MHHSNLTIKPGWVWALLIIILIIGLCSPVTAFTAAKIKPVGTGIQPGEPIEIRIPGLVGPGLVAGDTFILTISSNDLMKESGGGYELQSFAMPFGFNTASATMSATATNVDTLGLYVLYNGVERTLSDTPVAAPWTATINTAENVRKDTYSIIRLTGVPKVAGSAVPITLVMQGTIDASPSDPATLSFAMGGATGGSIRIQVNDGLIDQLDTTLTITAPPNLEGSETVTTPAIAAGTTATLDASADTGTVLEVTGTGAGVPAGTTVTVQEYSAPPAGSTAPPPSTYTVLGKYLTIDSSGLVGVASSMRIKFYYTDAELAAAGVTESTLRIYYYNAVTSAWEALTGGIGVDAGGKYVYGDTTHLSTFGMFGSVAAAPSAPSGFSGGGGGGSASAPRYVTSRNTATMLESDEGKALQPNLIETGQQASFFIPLGTTILGMNGKPISTVSVEMISEADVPAVPAGALYSFAGFAVRCLPDSVTFRPAASLTFSLTADEWNAVMAKANGNTGYLTVMFYDAANDLWVSVPTKVDPVARTVTGSVSHFSTYGLLVDTTAVSAVVTLPTPAITEVPATAAPTVAPVKTTAAPPAPGGGMPWALIIGVGVLIVIVLGVGYYFMTRKENL